MSHIYDRAAAAGSTVSTELSAKIAAAAADLTYTPADETFALPLGSQICGPKAATSHQGVVQIQFDTASGVNAGTNRIIVEAEVTWASNIRLQIDSGVCLVDHTGSATGMIPTNTFNNWTMTVGDTTRNRGYYLIDTSYDTTNLKSRWTHLQNSTNFLIEYAQTIQYPHPESTASCVLPFHPPSGTVTADLFTKHPRNFIVRNIKNSGSASGWGPFQIAGAANGYFGPSQSRGGTLLRFETDGLGTSTHGLSNILAVGPFYLENGNRVVTMTPHSATSDSVVVTGVYGTSNYGGVFFGADTAGQFTNSSVTTGCIVAGASGQDPAAPPALALSQECVQDNHTISASITQSAIYRQGTFTNNTSGLPIANPGGAGTSTTCDAAHNQNQMLTQGIATVGTFLGPVQDTNNTTTITYTLGVGETTTTGNLIVLYLAAAGSSTAVAISATDTRGNIYRVAKSEAPSGSVAGSILYSTQSIGLSQANSDSITVTLSHACTDKQLVIREVTHEDATPLDIAVSASLGGAGSATPGVSSSPTPSATASEYVATMTVWNGSATNTSDVGYTSVYAGHFDNAGAGQTKQMSVKDQVVTTTGFLTRTDLLGASQPWVTLLVSFKADTAVPVSTAKTAARGLSTRDGDKPPAGYEASFSNRMIDITWSTIQKTNGGALDATELARINALVDDAVTNSDTVTFRLFAGRYSPDWVMSLVGTFLHADVNAGTVSTPVKVPKFWKTAFWSAWDDLINKLATQYDGGSSPTLRQAAVRGCTAPLAMTYFGEPFQRHTNSGQNRAEMVGGGTGWTGTNIAVPGAGFSFADDLASQHKAIDIHAARWANTACHLTINPWQILYSESEALALGKPAYSGNNQFYLGSDSSGIPNTKAMIDYAITILGATNRLVLENNSPRDSYFDQTTLNGAQAASAATIKVISASSFASSGKATIINRADPTIFSTFTYTGKTTTSFTGCSGGSGNYADNAYVYANQTNSTAQMYDYFLAKPFARYYQCANRSNIGDYDIAMRGIVCVLLANACEPASNSGISPYDVANQAFWDTALRGNSLPAGGSTAHAPTNTATPTIDAPSAGYTPTTVLTAHLGGWDQGTNALISLHIQWYKKNPSTNISTSVRGPTSEANVTLTDTYTLQAGDLGSVIYVTVTATNTNGTSAAIPSAETPVVITPVNPAPVNTAVPVASPRTPILGDVITWDTGVWDNAPTSFRWDISRSNDLFATSSLIQSGISPVWSTSDADVGYAFEAAVTANNGQNSTPATSLPTSGVTAAPVVTLTVSADTVSSDTSTYTFTGSVIPRGTGVTITSFQVNGVSVTLAVDGSFSATVSVVPGLNTYTFTAIDSAGNTTTTSATIFSATASATSQDILDIEVRIRQRGLG